MFDPIFMNNLQQVANDNPLPTKPTRPIYHAKQNIYWGRMKQSNIHWWKAHAKNGFKMEVI
jgi:hypothetical protein